MEQIELKDISSDLLILNKYTIETLFKLDNCAECIALYVFYYKTAKWQKTNQIKASDEYVKKSLKWGIDKINRTKKTLKQNGLIDIVQKRENGKIKGWFIRVSYLVTNKKIEDTSIIVENAYDSNNTQKPHVVESTNGCEEINALKEKIKCLKNENKMLKEQIYTYYITNQKPKKEKAIKNKYGEYKNVLLKDEEFEKLKNEYYNYEDLIKFLDEYIEMKGYKAKSHYLCIKKWVVDAVKNEKKNKNNNKSKGSIDDFKEIMEEVTQNEHRGNNTSYNTFGW